MDGEAAVGTGAIMAQAAAFRHGGDLAAAAAAYPDAPSPWIDLSTGINPWPYPPPPIPMEAWGRLPGRGAEQALRRAACGYFAAPDEGCALAAPGTQALIQMLPRLLSGERVAILSPAYAEHAAAWRAAGRPATEITATKITAADMTDVAAPPPADILVTVNPNNPDGRIIGPEILLRWADAQAARGGWLIVDEAFADVTPEISVAPYVGRPGLIVLRSFGKFFGLAGARLGFLLAPPPIIAAAAAMLGPWAVGGPTLAVGAAAYADKAWIVQTRRRLATATARLDALLAAKNYPVVGGTDLFRLIGCADGAALFQRLARAGIWSRPFARLPHCLRLGLPPDEAGFARLAAALE